MEFGTTPKSGNQSVKRPNAPTPNLPGPSTPTPVSTKMSSTDLPNGWQINKSLGRSMLTMYDEGLWTDVTFRCKGQSTENLDERIRAHKIILAARSPVFQTMFFGSWQDGKTCIELKDIESNRFEKFIRTLYSDDFDLYEEYDDILDILELAHMYQFEEAVTGCFHKLGGMVSITNACQLLNMAFCYGNNSLRNRVAEFVDQNAEEVLKTDGFLELSLDGLTYLLKGNTFHAKEVNIFNRAEEWAKRRCKSDDGQMIRKTLGKAFFYLRTPAMPGTDFLSCTKAKGYFSRKEHEDIIEIIVGDQRIKKLKKVQSNLKVPRIPFQFTVTCPIKENTSMPSNFQLQDYCLIEISLKPHADIYLTDIYMAHFGYLFSLHPNGPMRHEIKYLPVKVSISINGHKSQYTIIYGLVETPVIHLEQPILLDEGQSFKLEVRFELEAVGQLRFWSDNFTGPEIFTGHKDIICAKYLCKYPLLFIKGLTFMGKGHRHSSIREPTILTDLT